MTWNLKQLSVLSLIVTAGAVAATEPVMDGTVDAVYGAPIVVQNTQTQFGDSNLGLMDWANGSELNAAYAFRTATHLYLFFAGNVETNHNKLTFLIDSKPGGQNRMLGGQPNVDFDAINRIAEYPIGAGNGMTFDPGFEADYWFSYTSGPHEGAFSYWFNYAEVGGTVGYWVGRGTTAGVPNIIYEFDNGWVVAVNNSNVLGVTGGIGLETPTTGLTTGVEHRIPLNLLGNPTGDIKVVAFINGTGNDFVSNQILGGIGGGPNFGEPRAVNFATIPGQQYFVVPAAPVATVNGIVDVEGVDVNVSPTVDIQFRVAGTMTNVGTPVTVTLGPNGEFAVTAPGMANYDITIKPRSSLRRTVNANTTAGSVNVGTIGFRVGDINDDNVIDLQDFLLLAASYEVAPPPEPLADLNVDGSVDLQDFLLLAANYELAGDN
jgi:hypothetical protein